MSNVLSGKFGENLSRYPETWDAQDDAFADYNTSPVELLEDMRRGVGVAMDVASGYLELLAVPERLQRSFRSDLDRELISVLPGDELTDTPEISLEVRPDMVNATSRASLAIEPAAVFYLSSRLIHVTHAAEPEDHSALRSSATTALTLIGIADYLSQIAGFEHGVQSRKQTVLSICANHQVEPRGDVEREFVLYDRIVSRLLGGNIMEAWLKDFIDTEAAALVYAERAQLLVGLRSLEWWPIPTMLNFALIDQLSSEEFNKLLDI